MDSGSDRSSWWPPGDAVAAVVSCSRLLWWAGVSMATSSTLQTSSASEFCGTDGKMSIGNREFVLYLVFLFKETKDEAVTWKRLSGDRE